MLCVSIGERTTEDVITALHNAKRLGADIAEVRLDFISKPDLARLLSNKPIPLIITVRPQWEGGEFRGTEEARFALLKKADELGADYIDIEFKAYKYFTKRRSKLILSYHNFNEVPLDLDVLFNEISLQKPDIIKIVVTPSSSRDILRIIRLQKSSRYPSAIFGMGEAGLITRLLYRRLGGRLTYLSLTSERQTAIGQIDIETAVNLYRIRELNSNIRLFCVIGNPVTHSKSPLIFNNTFNKLELNCVYIPFLLPDVENIRELIRELDISGLSVTMPYKTSVIPHLDAVDKTAQNISAVNTIVSRDSSIIGYNTDLYGAISTLKTRVLVLKDKLALVIGAGGVARAITVGLIREGAKVIIANRTQEKAKRFFDEFGCEYISLDRLAEPKPDIVINATPTDVKYEGFKKGLVVMDCIYNPSKTRFLQSAEMTGAITISGMEMFLRQAEYQWRLFFGKPLSEDILGNWRACIY